MKKTLCSYVLLVLAAVLMSACSGENKAAELYEIATFEELQTNTPHARQLYEEIIEKLPGYRNCPKGPAGSGEAVCRFRS